MKTLLIILGVLVSVVTSAQSGDAKILVKESGTSVSTFSSKPDGLTYNIDGNKLIISKEGETLKSAGSKTYCINDELLTDCFNSGSYKKCSFQNITLEKNGSSVCIVCNGCCFANVDEYVFKSNSTPLQAFIEFLDKTSTKGVLK